VAKTRSSTATPSDDSKVVTTTEVTVLQFLPESGSRRSDVLREVASAGGRVEQEEADGVLVVDRFDLAGQPTRLS
jgi:hypothetical protein